MENIMGCSAILSNIDGGNNQADRIITGEYLVV